jgi:nicotinate phosphoribosyltransferase
MAARLLGDKLHGVRLDTPSSRRGRMRDIVEEVRWALDVMGYRDVKIYVSGGIDEDQVRELRDLVDGFGVGTSIAWPHNIDISMDIVEVEEEGRWIPRSKRGKMPGAKEVYRCSVGDDIVVRMGEEPPRCRDGSRPRKLTRLYMKEGALVERLPSVEEIRRYVLSQLSEIKGKEAS